MANDVFANGREISCKAADGKSIAAFPDVCMTPPENPTTPPGVPVPYPNTGMARDATGGSKNVKISGKEVMLKNKSYFKKSTGDEAGSATKKGVITSVNRGKVYFTSWSMNVKCEGENVVRHFDMTTHNHASAPGQTPPWPYADSMEIDAAGNTDDPCAKDKEKEQKACEEFEKDGQDPCEIAGLGGTARPRTHTSATGLISARQQSSANDCINARRCRLQPYKNTKKGKGGCCPSQTGNHVIPESYFNDVSGYVADNAPCMCVTGTSWHSGNHQYLHSAQSVRDGFFKDSNGMISIEKAAENGGLAQKEVFKEAGCDEDCIKSQVVKGHEDMGLDKKTRVKHVSIAEQEKYIDRLVDVLDGNVTA